ncbi:exosome complex component RRP45-like [Uloborus diversus]|uniref:exosome complex component RRP45-like n=1 Tax=Uloborus diversus TaxID=327109 RepID=UPI0024097C52|nr:exosome complex component RRP45-like [Uloborus diversus]
MKIISGCEKDFITNCICKKQLRLDGRNLTDGRTLEIAFGEERGCCIVLLGNTRTLAQASAEITEPKQNTPNEGILHLNLEFSAMASPDAKAQSRSSDEVVEAQRLLERCIRDSKCIDLESLCIAAGSKVWTIRVDVHALNDDGNLIECSSIAAVSALAHFRRPDVSVSGTEVIVHDDHEEVALNMHHMPISVNLALYEQGKYILVDPIYVEEKVADGCYIMGINAHQEICYVHRRGVLLLLVEAVERCEDAAVKRAQVVTQTIRKALDDDAYRRATNSVIGFTSMINEGTILGAKKLIPEVDLESISRHEAQDEPEPEVLMVQDEQNGRSSSAGDRRVTKDSEPSNAMWRAMTILKEQEAAVFEGGKSKWGVQEEEDEEEESSISSEGDISPNVSGVVKKEKESESEEEAVYIDEDQVDVKPGSRGWYSKDPFI